MSSETGSLEDAQMRALDQMLQDGELTPAQHREWAFFIDPNREPALRDALAAIRKSSDEIWEQIAGNAARAVE